MIGSISHIEFSGFDEFMKDYEDAVLPEYRPNFDSVKDKFIEKIREDSAVINIDEYLEPCKSKENRGRIFHFAVIRGNWTSNTIIFYEFSAETTN